MFRVFDPVIGLYQKSRPAFVVLATTSSRPQSTASTEARPERITKNLSFRPAYDSPVAQPSRPLVLLYGWLVAKSRHIHKFGDYYLKRGYDVLHIKVEPLQLMRPSNAQKVVSHVVEFTQERPEQPVLIHGFSVGAYLLGETLAAIHANPDVRDNLASRIRGQVLDSPVDHDRVPLGVSRAVTPIPLAQAAIKTTLTTYMALTRNFTLKHYEKSSDMAKENKFGTPTMFMYSPADVIGIPEPIEELAASFDQRGIDVRLTKFADSKHVSHFLKYPVEYITALNGFLSSIGMDDLHGKVPGAEQEKVKASA